ncbi:Metallothionein-like protein type 2 [Bienertia sinuspersici]
MGVVRGYRVNVEEEFCKMFPDFVENTSNPTILISGVAPKMSYAEGSEMGVAAENDGCKCGPNCQCNPCTCK